jgi:hypothetical protein
MRTCTNNNSNTSKSTDSTDTLTPTNDSGLKKSKLFLNELVNTSNYKSSGITRRNSAIITTPVSASIICNNINNNNNNNNNNKNGNASRRISLSVTDL